MLKKETFCLCVCGFVSSNFKLMVLGGTGELTCGPSRSLSSSFVFCLLSFLMLFIHLLIFIRLAHHIINVLSLIVRFLSQI